MNTSHPVIKELVKQSGFSYRKIGKEAFKTASSNIYHIPNPTLQTIEKIKDAIKSLKNKEK